MNFLAHVVLASDTAQAWGCSDIETRGLVAGAIIGDFVKGRIPDEWPEELRVGVSVHRKIDALSNVHPAVSRTSAEFPKALRRYAPIFLDILADHSLARNWHHYQQRAVTTYSADCYLAIEQYRHLLPERGHRFVAYMMDVDLLSQYHHWEHVTDGLASVLRRLSKSPEKSSVLTTCHALTDATDEMLTELYPDLRDGLANWDRFIVAR